LTEIPENDLPQFVEPDGTPSVPLVSSVPVRKSEPRQKSEPRPRSEPRQKSEPRKRRKERYTLVTAVSLIRSLAVTFSAAVIASTIFMWFTSPDFLPARTRANLAPVQQTAQRVIATRTPLPTPTWFNVIGVLAGHSGSGRTDTGIPDPGSVCADGFTELSVTTEVAARVAAKLRGRGYTVVELGEFDERLDGFEAAAFISLHAEACVDYGAGYTFHGFKSTYPGTRFTVRDQDMIFNDCVRVNYAALTNMQFQANQITPNMLEYHAFRKIAPTTPGVILELGWLNYNRDMLAQPDLLADAIVNGMRCFLEPIALATDVAAPGSPVSSPTPGTPEPTASAPVPTPTP
jgi:N-acetylmuramoyl-L-alanine amidase